MEASSLDEAARRAAACLLREYGKLCMENLASGREPELAKEVWQEFASRALCYATPPDIRNTIDNDLGLQPSYASGLGGTADCWNDTFINESPFSHGDEDVECAQPWLIDEHPTSPLRSTNMSRTAQFATTQQAEVPIALRSESIESSSHGQDMRNANTFEFINPILDPIRLASTSTRRSSVDSVVSTFSTAPLFEDPAGPITIGSSKSARHRGRVGIGAHATHRRTVTAVERPDPHHAQVQKNNMQKARKRPRQASTATVPAMNRNPTSTSGDNLCSAKVGSQQLRAQDLMVGMGRPESMLHLHAILSQAKDPLTLSNANQSAQTFAEAFRILEIRDDIILFNVLQQFQSAIVLYECLQRETLQQSSGHFQLIMPESFERRGPRRIGNPRNLQKADISASLMRKIAPDVDESNSEYKKTKARATDFCKCGRRLASMADRFGQGSTCVALVASELERQISNWRHHILFALSESDFDHFLTQLDRTHGDYLRALSMELDPILSFIRDPASSGDVLPLQSLQVEKLLQLRGDELFLDRV